MRPRRLFGTLAVLCLSPAPAAVMAAPASPLEQFQQREAQLFTVGWRLARSNAPYCRETIPAIGLLIHDATAYGNPAEVRRTFGLSGDIGVQAVAPDSPAEGAGIGANATLLAIAGADIDDATPPEKPAWKRGEKLRDRIDGELAKGQIALRWARSGEQQSATIEGVPVCASRFEMLDSSDKAKADGKRILFGHRFPAFTWPEDELAAAVAHELAHNLLDHIDRLRAEGRPQRLVRLSERDADRLMPWLLRNAGYDPQAAIRFMRKWGPAYDGGLLRKRNHDGWDERVAEIVSEIAAMDATYGPTGPVDWRTQFRQDLPTSPAQ